VQIILFIRWCSYIAYRMHIEPFLGNIPRHMGTDETHGQKKRLFIFFVQPLDRPFRSSIVRHFIIALRKCPPVGTCSFFVPFKLFFRLRPKTLFPSPHIVKNTIWGKFMEDLSFAHGMVTIISKIFGKEYYILCGLG